MRSSESNTIHKINSEIHASLRRLEDADYVYNQVLSEDMGLLIDQSNEADNSLQSQINDLSREVYRLHNYIEPHILNGDLRQFQNIDIGNIKVTDGGRFDGIVSFWDTVTIEAPLNVRDDLRVDSGGNLYAQGLWTDSQTEYAPHSLTIDGTALDGSILATQDMTFDPAGLVEGNGSGGTLTIRTKKNHTSLLTYTLEPKQSYNSTTHKYQVWCNLLNSTGGTVTSSGSIYTNDQAYKDGQDDAETTYPPHSSKFKWSYTDEVTGVPYFIRTGGEYFGKVEKTVWWED